MAVEVNRASETFEHSRPRELFSTQAVGIYTRFAVTADGQRFAILVGAVERLPEPATVVVNWGAALRK
jgi:hypothetical protein